MRDGSYLMTERKTNNPDRKSQRLSSVLGFDQRSLARETSTLRKMARESAAVSIKKSENGKDVKS